MGTKEAESEEGAADLCVFRIERGFDDAVEVLKAAGEAGHVARGAWVVGHVKLGNFARNRRAAERAQRALRAAGYGQVRVLHFLADRETERTVVAKWRGDVGAATSVGAASAAVATDRP